MEETTLLIYDLLQNVSSSEDKETIRKKLYPYFNGEEKRHIRTYEAMLNSFKGKYKINKIKVATKVLRICMTSRKYSSYFQEV